MANFALGFVADFSALVSLSGCYGATLAWVGLVLLSAPARPERSSVEGVWCCQRGRHPRMAAALATLWLLLLDYIAQL